MFKHKTLERSEKIANTPERCFIENSNVSAMMIPVKLDIKWYIEVAKKRLNDFLAGGGN